MNEIGAVTSDTAAAERADLRASAGGAPRGDQLVGDRGEREDVRRRTPLPPLDPLGRRIRPADRSAETDPFERLDDSEAGRARLVRCDEDVPRVERTMADAGGAGEIEGPGQLSHERQHLAHRSRSVVAKRDIQ